MSADLFAEFSNAPVTQQQKRQGAQPNAAPFSFLDDFDATPTQASAHAAPESIAPSNVQQDEDDNDDWGDFEGDTSSFEPPPLMKQDSFAFVAAAANRARAPTLPPTQENWTTLMVSEFESFSYSTPQASESTWQSAPVLKAKKSADPSVLFDAEDGFGDDDDFGNFEEPESYPSNDTTKVPTGSAGVSALRPFAGPHLLGDLDLSQPAAPIKNESVASAFKAPISPSFKSLTGGFGSVAPEQRTKAAPSAPAPKEEDAWDTFDDWEASIPTKAPAKVPSKLKATENEHVRDANTLVSPPPVLSPTFNDPQPGELPPTNVPPPAVLLTLFPPLFADAQDKLFKPMAAQTLPMRNKVLAEPATITFLQGYIMLASVAAHIIAGRKLRWKRDHHLSQGMRIGPASSRATSGMKLSSIDKSENMKEEREASDVVRAWKNQIGRLRHVVSAANQIKAGSLGVVPDIQETMSVKVLKQGEGGVPAKEPCMLCGLKRDERVGAVDQGVEDSFGEWWVDQVNMHRSTSVSRFGVDDTDLFTGCRNFWNEHRDRLRQR
ncbi:hypothetical protein BU23DRAFT_524053 [Bimuria novae-zelandiae CBS 107.79]|uniref:Uncharacterized protein n=1 Tax=Bimuria novae-zelandiae CBS 107.79 TaxID=1447943 RepID=A0A6A5VQ11_9PLEO|nr:hypothetical protein BU23DRAFT_524053 [Bimuria novae-zelandiae CBS 107.79]